MFSSKSFDLGLADRAIDLHAQQSSRKSGAIRVATAGDTSLLDVNLWLPRAAEHYNISADIRDYVIQPVVACITDLPNTHGDAFGMKDLLTFNPKCADLAYRTYRRRPTFVEHANSDYRKASGVILDTRLSPLKGFGEGYGRLIFLLAFDRSRHPDLCRSILKGEQNTYSKGTYYGAYTCSICGQTFSSASKHFCNHLGKRVQRLSDGRLAYKNCHVLEGFECSAVWSPAFICASPDPESTMDPRNKGRW